MNTKLDILCAERVMHYGPQCPVNFKPSSCMDDALMVLERAANNSLWQIFTFRPAEGNLLIETEYACKIGNIAGHTAIHKYVQFAMCICALRASGVSEAEIQECLNG